MRNHGDLESCLLCNVFEVECYVREKQRLVLLVVLSQLRYSTQSEVQKSLDYTP